MRNSHLRLRYAAAGTLKLFPRPDEPDDRRRIILLAAAAGARYLDWAARKDSPPLRDVPGDEHEHEGEAENTYGLPEGEDIEAELRRTFAAQAEEVLGAVPSIGEPLPRDMPGLDGWDRPMAEAMTPLISAYWDKAGHEIRAKIGLEPDAWPSAWKVTDPHVRDKIEKAAFAFCQSTNQTTSQQLGDALTALRKELTEGIVDEGDGVRELTKRVKRVFDGAETYRARRIAATEASRAVHEAQMESVRESGVVTAKRLLLSANSCPLCHSIKEKEPPGGWPLDEHMAVIGDDPHYSKIPCPPLHPSCRCTITFVTIYNET